MQPVAPGDNKDSDGCPAEIKQLKQIDKRLDAQRLAEQTRIKARLDSEIEGNTQAGPSS